MNDIELLSLAAKSIGGMYIADSLITFDNVINKPWNPLNDSGDSLELAIQLKLQINTDDDDRWGVHRSISIIRPCGGYNTALSIVAHNENPITATRKAIVMAAAKIGSNRI